MSKVLGVMGNCKIVKTGRGYVAINMDGEEKHHSHFDSFNGSVVCVDLVRRRKIPKARCLVQAAIRLTTDEFYKQELERIARKMKTKQKYYNQALRYG